MYVCVFIYVYVPVFVRFSLSRFPLKMLKSDLTKLGVKDAIGVPSFVNEVKGLIPRSSWGKMLVFVIWGLL